MHFVYPYTVHQSDDGAWQVRFPDVPEALTEGATEAEAHELAPDALLSALGGLEKLRRDIPDPSPRRSRPVVVVPVLQSAKLALYRAIRKRGLNNVKFARELGVAENEVRRMLDLDHRTHIEALESALQQLGGAVIAEIKLAA